MEFQAVPTARGGKSNPELSRRSLLLSGAAALGTSALSYARIIGANDRIRLGHVGVGNRGRELASIVGDLKESHNLEMVAVCDSYEAGKVTGPEAADALYDYLERAPFVPRHWGWTERDLRFINPTFRRISKTMWWAATKAQPDVRELLLGFGRECTRELLHGRRVL